MIESYNFGEIKILGKTYRSDIIVYPDHVNTQWWRKEGHNLTIEDIKEVIEARPEVIIIGTGQPGLMKVPKETKEMIDKCGIEIIILPTDKACQEYNRVATKKNVIACLHLTC